MLQMARAGSIAAGDEASAMAASAPGANSFLVNTRVAPAEPAIHGVRPAVAGQATAPKPISHHATWAGGTPAMRSSTSAR